MGGGELTHKPCLNLLDFFSYLSILKGVGGERQDPCTFVKAVGGGARNYSRGKGGVQEARLQEALC
jgi:hypothetical protein